MKLIHKLPVFLLLILPLTLSGQKRWTLEECIRYAWENNLRIKQQVLAIEQSKNNAVQAKYAFAPTVSGSISHNMNWGRSVNMQTLEIIENKLSQSSGMSVRASVDIFEGNNKVNDLKNKEVFYEIAMQNAIKMKNDISLEISRSFLQVLLSRDILASAKSSLSSVQAQADRSKKLVDAGSQAYGPYLEITAQLAREKVQVVNAENQLRANLLSLKQLLDLPGDNDFDIAVPSVNLDNLSFMGESVENIYTAALGLPQIKSAELSHTSSKIQLKLAQGRHLPTLSFSAGYGTNYSDSRSDAFFQQLKDNRNPSIGFSLSVPIFTSFSIKTGVKNAKLDIIKYEIDLKNTQQALYKEIQQVVNDASSQYAQMKASAENVKAMEESFRYVQQKFDVGAANATDYTVAKTNLFKAQSDLLQSKYQLLFQMKVLDFYKGKPISL